MKKASWILLTVLGVAITLLSLVSAAHAYRPQDDYAIGDSRVSRIAGGDAGAATALRGIRGTSAAYAAAYGILFLAVVLGPYRRGEAWASRALLVAGLVQAALVLVRMPLLDTQRGVSAAVIQTAILLVGLLLGLGRSESSAR